MKRIYTSCLFCLYIGCVSVSYGQSFQDIVDSLQLSYSAAEDELSRIDLLNEIAYAYRRVSPDSVMRYADQAIELAEKKAYKQGLAYGYKNRGIGYYKFGASSDTIIFNYQKAIDYAKEIDDYYTQAACYNNIGLIKSYGLSAYNEAAQYFLQGVAVFDEHIKEEKRLKALMLANIGTAYHRDGNNKLGIRYYEEALAMAERLGELSIPSIFVDELARARMEEGDIEGALSDILELMPLHDQIGDYESKGETLITLSEVKMKMGRYSEAIAHAEEAVKVAEEYGFPQIRAIALVRLAESLKAAGKLEEATKKAELALEKKGVGFSLAVQIEAVKLLADLYALQGEHSIAYEYATDYSTFLLQDQDENKQRISDELEAKYSNEKQFLEIESLKKEREEQKARFYQLIVFVLFFIGVSVIMGYMITQKNKATAALNEKNLALQNADQRLNEKNQQLERYIESNLQLENFAHLASHDLREPMRNIVSFSQLLTKSGKGKLNEIELEYLDFIRKGTGRIEGLVQDLLAYSTISNSPLSLSTFSLPELIEEVKSDIAQILLDKAGTVTINSIPDEIHADRSRIYQLLQNLFINALRYSRPDIQPEISLEETTSEGYYHFKVSDNGKGIAPQFYEQIFVLFKSLENKSNTNSSGIGLATCKKVTEDHKGRIWVESEENKGSIFHFTIATDLG